MDQVIVAFENQKNLWRVKELLEASGAFSCIVCKSADQVRRTVRKLHITAVVCGYKLSDQSAETLFEDLPLSCAMLVLASQDLLELIQNDDIFRLATPVSKGDLVASVRMLTQISRRLERFVRPARTQEAQEVIEQAKRLLMDRNGMTEEQAHRFLQKVSMDSRSKLTQTAQMVLDGAELG
ncbi:ANTAR domain-containing response regulator [Intestinimonas massiliensis (ex Afouda et al. 2020)]|uniref:ANTAR domain-containing response regulator n=1 Tax=Intestinimonas massiliensis (ex Afouda et al. 2020) TaxID=1673721 RepID=UPI001031F091|nr:ANTAR domain-containing protein [Intestinimonas massiliensis (ex Afouda et al. 2020)]